MDDRFSFTETGCPSAIAFGGQASVHRLHDSQNSVTPKLIGESWATGASVKIYPNRTRGPNSGVMTRPCLPYSPSPAWMAWGMTNAESLRLGTAL